MKTRTRAGSATIIAARTIPAGRKDGHAAHVIRCASCNTAQYSTCRVPEQTNERSNCWPDSAYVLTWMKRRVATWKKALRRSAPGLIANKPSVVAQRERQRAQRQHRAPRQLSRLDVHRRERRPRWHRGHRSRPAQRRAAARHPAAPVARMSGATSGESRPACPGCRADALIRATNSSLCHSGARALAREPGIHNHNRCSDDGCCPRKSTPPWGYGFRARREVGMPTCRRPGMTPR